MKKLTGIEIYKLLPRTNCGDCNFPTCMAFAMQVAAKKVPLDQCPHVSEEAKQALGEAQAPPMRTVTIGRGEREWTIGGETVLFRHDEKFYHPAAVAVKVSDNLGEEELRQKLAELNSLKFIRVGEEIGVNLAAISHEQNGGDFLRAVGIAKETSQLPLILIDPEDPDTMAKALELCGEGRPLIYAATEQNWQAMAELAKQHGCPLAVRAPGLEGLAELTGKLKETGIEDLILDPGSRGLPLLTDLIKIRRLALEKTFRPLGYPTIAFTQDGNPYRELAQATAFICKYGSIVVLENSAREVILPLLTVRQNIYTDPQVPNAIEAKLYEIGSPGPDAPVLVTTNFALTYFTVEGEVENSKMPAYIAVVDTEGLGVLNAYADDKLTAEKIIKTVQEYGVMDRVKHNKLIIPGLVAVLRMEIQEDSGWEVIVGPEDAAGIPSFLRNEWHPNGSGS